MNQHIKIKVRPQERVRFPGICIHCLQPAATSMRVYRRNGRYTRLIDVPLCTSCAAQRKRRSGEEERLQKISQLLMGITFLVVTIIVLLLTNAALAFWLRLLLAMPLATGATIITQALFRPTIKHAALPETKAVRDAATITDFSWRATTFTFTNELFTEKFLELNKELLIET